MGVSAVGVFINQLYLLNNYGFDVVIVTCSLVCLALILLCSGDVERNPGPGPKRACPQCSCMVHTRKLVCECGFSFKLKPNIQSIVPEPKITCTTPKRICRTKRCPSCELWLNIEQSVCECGYDYADPIVNSPDCKDIRKNRQRLSMASLRASESPEALCKTNLQSKIAMASLRAGESLEASLKIQSHNCVVAKRHKVLSVEHAILDFYAIIKEGPNFVCTVCTVIA